MSEEPVFTRVLIANRGEIAVRIAQTCREMGIQTIAVYSTAEADALHVRACDEAYCIGPPSPLESYLSIDAIIGVARESHADAVHPGYGFLAESEQFARAVIAAGVSWIGPPPGAIALMGDKVAAKALARALEIPIIPGYEGKDQSIDRMLKEAAQIGFPIMVKAAAGGGGRGMRAVTTPADLAGALASARREAHSAFGDDRMFLEKLLVDPRHIEIQVLLDAYGTAVYLGERDCSLQRRHQKVVEESPSPVVNADLRVAMGQAALRLARAGGYVNAGTVEFVLSDDRFYFLEMNARIQVEHPVTEAVTGLDLVRLQLEVAANRPLGLSQLDIVPRGHAIQARLYAEDANAGFLPGTGELQVFRPPSGPGVRNDIGVEEGSVVSSHYDAMLAKLVVHAANRETAVARLRRALAEYEVSGVVTNLEFLRWIAALPEFVRGGADTGLIDRCWKPAELQSPPPEVLAAAAIRDVLAGTSGPAPVVSPDAHSPWSQGSYWRLGRAPRTLSYRQGEHQYEVQLSPSGSADWVANVDGVSTEYTVRHWLRSQLTLDRGSSLLRFEIEASSSTLATPADGTKHALTVDFEGRRYHLEIPVRSGQSSATATGGVEDVPRTPMPGTVVRLLVEDGQRVHAHDPLVILEAMKMEHIIEAPRDALIRRVLVTEGELVAAGAPVVEFEGAGERDLVPEQTNG